jgi:phenylacetate-CoA ligase
MGLFQIVRAARECDVLQLRVGYAPAYEARVATVRVDVADALQATLGVDAEIEMVPNAALLKLGPPHKIPRVAPR